MIVDWGPVLLALVVSVVAPSIMSILTTRQLRAGKQEDYARQDAVAEKAEAVAAKADIAARTLVESNRVVAAKAMETAQTLVVENRVVADKAAAERAVASGKLDVIHSLVNSTLTEAMQEALDATERNIELLKRLSNKTEKDDADIIAATEAADVLRKKLVERAASAP